MFEKQQVLGLGCESVHLLKSRGMFCFFKLLFPKFSTRTCQPLARGEDALIAHDQSLS